MAHPGFGNRRIGLSTNSSVGLIFLCTGAIVFVVHIYGLSLPGYSDFAIISGPNRNLSVGILSGSALLSVGITSILVGFSKRRPVPPQDVIIDPPGGTLDPDLSKKNWKIRELEKENRELTAKVKWLEKSKRGDVKIAKSLPFLPAAKDGKNVLDQYSVARYEDVSIIQENGINASLPIMYSTKVPARSPRYRATELIKTNKISMHIDTRVGKIIAKTISGGRYDFISGGNSGYWLEVRCEYDDGHSLDKCVEIIRKLGFACYLSDYSATCFLERGLPTIEEKTKLLSDICKRIVKTLKGATLQ